jgi:hypothetical protein
MNISSKPQFRIEKSLFLIESIKQWVESHSQLIIEGLLKIDRDNARVFYFQDPKDDKSLTSEIIKL